MLKYLGNQNFKLEGVDGMIGASLFDQIFLEKTKWKIKQWFSNRHLSRQDHCRRNHKVGDWARENCPESATGSAGEARTRPVARNIPLLSEQKNVTDSPWRIPWSIRQTFRSTLQETGVYVPQTWVAVVCRFQANSELQGEQSGRAGSLRLDRRHCPCRRVQCNLENRKEKQSEHFMNQINFTSAYISTRRGPYFGTTVEAVQCLKYQTEWNV